MSEIYPRSGRCQNCRRRADDLFYHREDDRLYCTDVFECEARYEAKAQRYWQKRYEASARRV